MAEKKENVDFSDESCRGSVLQKLRSPLPHCVLVIAYVLYLAIGGVIFTALEAPLYSQLSAEEQAKMTEANHAKMVILDAYNNVSRGQKPEVFNITALLDSLIDTVDHPDWKAGRKKSLMGGRGWSFPSSMLFAMTTITTIGYGDLVPETLWGRIFCVAYSAVGVPFSFFLLADIGQVLAIAFIKVVRRCRGIKCQRKSAVQTPQVPKFPTGPPPVATPNTKRKADVRRGGRPNVTMRHLKSVRLSTDKTGQESCRVSTPRSIQKQLNDKGMEMSDLATSSTDRGQMNINNSAQDQSSHAPPYGTGDIIVTTVSEESKEPPQVDEKKNIDQNESDESEAEDYHENDVPLPLVLAVLVSYMLISAYAFSFVEGWDYGTSVYFIFITLTTIGFGDIVPDRQYNERFFPCLLFTIFGLAVTSMCIALAQDSASRAGKRLLSLLSRRTAAGERAEDPEQGLA